MHRARAPARVAVLCTLLSLPWSARSENAGELASVVVTATRTPQDSKDLPVSIDRIDARTIRNGQLQVNISESLVTVPGVSAQSRQNYAQDEQLSVRGFGARSSFGVRGVRLYADGIPGTMPDGQGQFSQFDLGSAGHMEVLRGPFSALYGNSSGGVISIFTEDAKPGYSPRRQRAIRHVQHATLCAENHGRDGTSTTWWMRALSNRRLPLPQQRRAQQLQRQCDLTLSDAANLTFVANAIETPYVQDPLGLTQAQLAANPSQAGTGAIQYNTRKLLHQEQIGAVYDNRLSAADELTGTLYAGQRATTQFQAIPQATEQRPPVPGRRHRSGPRISGASMCT